MTRTRFSLVIPAAVALLITGGWTAFSQSQGLITRKALSVDMAEAIAQGALRQCRSQGYHVSVTVVDDDGVLKAFLREDGAGPHTIDYSRKKAYTAATLNRTSAESGKVWVNLQPTPNMDGTTGTAGGVPIRAGNEVIGGVGVSGSPGGAKDEVCANAGLAKVANELK